ncbi:MAG: glutathione S-transferase family protein [Polyangiaceae bacterium]
MITLYQFAPAFDLPNPSPFCFKVENYLRMTGLDYETRIGNPRAAPKRKLPFIKDGGVVVSDSTHIVQHLVKTRGDKLDAHLPPEERARGHVIRRMLEEGTYFCLLYARWVDDTGFEPVRARFFSQLPPVARSLVPHIARRLIRKQVESQGTGRHAPEDIYAMAAEDIAALASLLGDRPYFLGDHPTSTDAAAYAFLALSLWAPVPAGLTGVTARHPALVAYCERMRARYYPADRGDHARAASP